MKYLYAFGFLILIILFTMLIYMCILKNILIIPYIVVVIWWIIYSMDIYKLKIFNKNKNIPRLWVAVIDNKWCYKYNGLFELICVLIFNWKSDDYKLNI